MKYIDLRSDTVTQPTAEMRKAMAMAEVGDDVMGEDPTVNRLQDLAAEVTGKEAGLFVPSGTMGNLAGVLSHCERGDEAIMGHLGHTFLFEAGGVSALGGVVIHTVPNQPDGTLLMTDLDNAIRADDIHQPRSRLVILENTHNRCGGVVITARYMKAVGQFAKKRHMLVHLDGARIFNAAAALNEPVCNLAEQADSISFCLSKGLCAPVGSVLCGSQEFITKARRIRKQLGGGMRQAGILAAAGVIAMKKMAGRLVEDHRRAQDLAAGLQNIDRIELPFGLPQTNMVFAALSNRVPKTAREIADQLKTEGVLVGVVGPRTFRLVTHYWIDDAGIKRTIGILDKALHSS